MLGFSGAGVAGFSAVDGEELVVSDFERDLESPLESVLESVL